jgi:DNA-binding NarL/FixJ family response regulator
LRRAKRGALEERFGCIREEASNGADGISKAREHEPDLAILDLSMTVINGYDASIVLRREMPTSKIVIVTMFADVIGKTSAGMLNVQAVVAKSDGLPALITCVQKLPSS